MEANRTATISPSMHMGPWLLTKIVGDDGPIRVPPPAEGPPTAGGQAEDPGRGATQGAALRGRLAPQQLPDGIVQPAFPLRGATQGRLDPQ